MAIGWGWAFRATSVAALVLAALGAPVRAQHPAARAGGIAGMVFDSLDHRPLGDASVFLLGTALTATTDAGGRYVLDSVPEGSYRIAFESGTLDTIGLTPNPRAAVVRAGAVDTVNLFVPSVETLLDAMCPASRAAGGESIVVGSVRDAATGAPLAAATVTLSWSDIAASRGRIVQTNHQVPAVTAADGSYAVCGLPGDAVVSLRGVAQGHTSGMLQLAVPPGRLVRRDVGIDAGHMPNGTAASRGQASLAGLVIDAAGHPLSDADVSLAGLPETARSDEEGRFRLGQVPGGSWDVLVQRIGFLPLRTGVELHPGVTTASTLTLRAAGTLLDTIRVRARAPDAHALGEKAREFPGATFFSRASIDSMHAYRVTDILRHAKGVQLVYPDSGGPPIVQMARSRFSDIIHAGLCPVEFYVDGVPFDMKNSPDIHLHPADIEAIEVYDGASNIPPEYQSGSAACGVVVIWLKHTGP